MVLLLKLLILYLNSLYMTLPLKGWREAVPVSFNSNQHLYVSYWTPISIQPPTSDFCKILINSDQETDHLTLLAYYQSMFDKKEN